MGHGVFKNAALFWLVDGGLWFVVVTPARGLKFRTRRRSVADDTRDHKPQQGQPPAGGAQDHDAMRAASMRPVTGPASTDNLAAIGGLNVPGGDASRSARIDVPTAAPVHEPIPGERDPHNITHREPGAMGSAFGQDMPIADPHVMLDEATAHDRMLEGGGEDHKHHHNTDGYVKRGK
jgi:hypothetical protein